MDSVSESRRQALEAMPAGDLKRLIAALGLSSEGCVEKADLVALVASAEAKANRGPPTPSDANRGPAGQLSWQRTRSHRGGRAKKAWV